MIRPNMDIRDYLGIAWRRKWLILLPFVVISLGVSGWAYRQSDLYRSSTTILVERQKVPEAYVRPTVTTSIAERLSTISQQIMSRTRLQTIIDQFQLYSELKKTKNSDELIEQMQRDIDLKVKGQDAFTISYQGTNPQTVMMVTTQLASLYIGENIKVREQQAEGTSEFLEVQLKQMREKLEGLEKAVQTYKQQHMGELPSQQDANLKMLEQLRTQLQSNQEVLKGAEERRLLLEKNLSDVDPQQVSPALREERGPSPPSRPEILKAQLEAMKTQLEALKLRYSDRHPDVATFKREVAELEKKVEKAELEEKEEKSGKQSERQEGSTPSPQVSPNPYHRELVRQLEEVRLEIKALRAEQGQLRQQIIAYQARVENAPQRELELTSLTRDYEVTRTNYQSLLDKRMNSQLAENMERRQKGEQFRILDPANLPQKPFKPDRPRLVLLGILLGLGAGFGLAFFREYLDHSFRDVEDLKEHTQLPVLAAIPALPFAEGGRLRSLPRRLGRPAGRIPSWFHRNGQKAVQTRRGGQPHV